MVAPESKGPPLNVLFVSAEVAPFAKTGGLGDVSGAIPRYLAKLGHDVRVVLPLYRRVREHAAKSGITFARVLDDLSVQLGQRKVSFSVVEARLPGTGDGRTPPVPCYFVAQPSLYDRPGIYTQDDDEHLRFVVLQWASLKLCQFLRFAPHVVHANDWQTGLLPLMVKTAFAWDKLFARTKSVLTIHNIGHQGTFGADKLPDTGMLEVREHFHQDDLNAGRFNFLQTGILYADAITTVSPTYAREIQTSEHGVGLDGFLRMRGAAVVGILNGIDEDVWSPEVDRLIPQRYGEGSIELKEVNKKKLLDTMRLPYHHRAPVFGIVSRMAWQKGFDLCMEVLPRLLAQHDAQVVVLGSGDPKYEGFFAGLARQFPHKAAFHQGFSEPLAHLIEAGSDFFLMPSRYEPCGLNQMYSLRYGTLPIVHKTGGLADTVRLVRSAHLEQGNGIVFEHFDGTALKWALSWALELWGTGDGADRARFREIQRRAMREELGWSRRIHEYVRVYRSVLGR
jgi:starch synthase